MKIKALFLLFTMTNLVADPSADSIYAGKFMAVQSYQDIRYHLDPSASCYLVPPLESDSIESKNLFPVLISLARSHKINLTNDKTAAKYWILWDVDSDVVGENGDNPMARKVFQIVVYVNGLPASSKIWQIEGNIVDTPSLDPSSVMDKLLDHFGSNFRGYEKVRQK
ncbi:MAG: hypothetical protein LV480_01515 [Methylacidiphilales bacterium]|nr:hypothetical protein [Candidatus Methylacidiphilales bacterium]